MYKRILKKIVSGRIFASYKHGLSDLLMYGFFIDHGIILQTDGSFLCAFSYRASDLDTSTDAELNVLSKQLNDAFSLLDSGWLFHIDIIRHLSNDYIDAASSCFELATLKLIDDSRRYMYTKAHDYYENEYIISFTYKPKIDFANNIGIFFNTKSTQNSRNTTYSQFNNNFDKHLDYNQNDIDSSFNDYSYYLKYFKTKLEEVFLLLQKQLNLSKMNNQELLSYISFCIKGEYTLLRIPIKHGVFLKHFLANADLVAGDRAKIGDQFMRAITIMGLPNESYPGILDKLNHLNFSYRFNTRFIVIDQYEGKKIIDKISNLWYQKRISTFDTLKMSLSIDSNVKIDQYSANNYTNAEEALAKNSEGSIKFGFYTASIILYNVNNDLLEKHAAQIRSVLLQLGFQSQIERHHVVEAFLGSLPGYAYANIRKWLIHTQNIADMMPNTSIWSGLNYNPCKLYKHNNPPLFYANTSGMTPIRLSLHVADNGHTLIVGPVGSGKSTFLNFLISQHFRYKNSKVFVFDKNRSSFVLCRSCDGQFYDILPESSMSTNNALHFQPLANLETELDFNFALSWLEELCILNGMEDSFKDEHRFAIKKALVLMKTNTPKNRRTISYFRYLVQDHDNLIASVLNNFSSESNLQSMHSTDENIDSDFLSKLFDANEDRLNFNNIKFNSFEMAYLMSLGDRIIVPVIRYLMHVISKQFDQSDPSLIIFDESFLFFKHQLFREKIIDWIKTVRKFNVAIIFSIQDLSELFKYEDLKLAILNNCATKFFLANKKALDVSVYEQYKLFGLNDKQINLIAHAVIDEYIYISELASRKFTLNLIKDELTFSFVAKTNSQDIQRAMSLYKLDKDNFVLNWLKECKLDDKYKYQWLYYDNQFKNLN